MYLFFHINYTFNLILMGSNFMLNNVKFFFIFEGIKNQKKMNANKIIYWLATGIMAAVFIFSSYNYFFNYDMIAGFFDDLGFPRWIIYPLAVAKILGLIAIFSNVSKVLKEWAYAGFFFDAVLAFGAHYMAEDGQGLFSIIAIVTIVISRIFDERLKK